MNEHDAKAGLIYYKWTVKNGPKDGPILCTKMNDPTKDGPILKA